MTYKQFTIQRNLGKYAFYDGNYLMAFIYSYADDSGLEGQPCYCAVCGYVASERVWERFRREWKSVLGKYHVSEFHASKFFNRFRGGVSDHNEFSGWPDEKALKFEQELLNVICKNHRLHPTGSVIDVPAFNVLTVGERRFLTGAIREGNVLSGKHKGTTGKPWFVPFRSFIQQSLAMIESGTTLELVFDEQAQMKHTALQIHGDMKQEWYTLPGKEKLGGIDFEDSKDKVELQAADLLTYSVRYFAKWGKPDLVGMDDERYLAISQLFHKNKSIGLHDAKQLEHHLNAGGPEFRSYLHTVTS